MPPRTRNLQQEPNTEQPPEHERLIDSTKNLMAQVEANVDRLREIRGQVNECINTAETFLSAIASGAPKAVRTPR